MCRNIRTLFNFEPPATEAEIRAASLQFVRKLSGFQRPSQTNQAAFDQAVDSVAATAREFLDALVTNAPPRDRRGRSGQSAGTRRGALRPDQRRLIYVIGQAQTNQLGLIARGPACRLRRRRSSGAGRRRVRGRRRARGPRQSGSRSLGTGRPGSAPGES